MMERDDNSSAVICNLCGEVFTLPEDEVSGNTPRVLLCGHIYCTACLRSIQCDCIIKCPECEVESTLPEGGVDGLQEDSRIVGLIYTAKMRRIKRTKNRRRAKLSLSKDETVNTEDMMQTGDVEKIEKALDEALVRAAENLAMLENIHETLSTGLAEQRERERARLEMEVKQVAVKAVNATHKWRDVQLSRLAKLEAPFSTSKAELCRVEERLKALKIAMQMAKEVRRIPVLGQYCTLDKVLETLQAPVDNLSFNMNCITMGSGIRYVFQLMVLNQNVTMSLKMDNNSPKDLTSPVNQHGIQRRCEEQWNSNFDPPNSNMSPTPTKRGQESTGTNSPSSHGSSPCLSTRGSSPPCRSNLSLHSSGSDHGAPDVIIEELLDEVQEQAVPPTGPELANDKWRVQRRRKSQLLASKRNGREKNCDKQVEKYVLFLLFPYASSSPALLHFFLPPVGEAKFSMPSTLAQLSTNLRVIGMTHSFCCHVLEYLESFLEKDTEPQINLLPVPTGPLHNSSLINVQS